MKEYKHRGFTLRATDVTTDKLVRKNGAHKRELRHCYEIIDPAGCVCKDAMTRPFLTSIRECKAEIDEWLETDVDQHHPGRYADPSVPPTEEMLRIARAFMNQPA